MPAPRPSMTAITDGERRQAERLGERRQQDLADHRRRSARRRASRAIAASERNRSVSRMIAMPTPISSPTGASCSEARSIRMPRAATSTPSLLGGLGGGDQRLAVGLLEVGSGRSCSGRRPRRAGRPRETAPPSANGSATCATPVERLDLRRARPRSPACGSGSVSLPSSTLKTSVESAPANAGLWAWKRSIACWDSVPGIEKSSAASPPAPAAAPSRTITTIAPRGRASSAG